MLRRLRNIWSLGAVYSFSELKSNSLFSISKLNLVLFGVGRWGQKCPKCPTLRFFEISPKLFTKLTWNFQSLIFWLFEYCSKKILENRCYECPEPRPFLDDVISEKVSKNVFLVFFEFFTFCHFLVVFTSKNHIVSVIEVIFWSKIYYNSCDHKPWNIFLSGSVLEMNF